MATNIFLESAERALELFDREDNHAIKKATENFRVKIQTDARRCGLPMVFNLLHDKGVISDEELQQILIVLGDKPSSFLARSDHVVAAIWLVLLSIESVLEMRGKTLTTFLTE